MKLQNLLYATMVACAFSACSNDDDQNIPEPTLEMNATLTAAFNPVGNSGSSLKSTTKAGDDAYGNVNRIGIAVFNNGAMSTMADDALLSYAEKENESDTTACVAAREGAVKLLVIANPTTNLFDGVSTLDGFLGKISEAEINSDRLLMSSKVYDLTLKAGRNVMVDNLTGSDFESNTSADQVLREENVKLYRNVARIEVPRITVNPREGFGKGHGATFTLKKIFIGNVRSGVRVGGIDGTTGLFAATQAWNSVVDMNSNLISGDNTESNPAYYKEFSQQIAYAATDASGKSEGISDAQFFVYDNASDGVIAAPGTNATLLVIKGDYVYTTDAGATASSIDAYWTVAINNDLLASAGKEFPQHCGVLRNVKYSMNITITGPGSGDITTESNAASLTSQIEVVNWGELVFDPSID